ncbi:MAG: geranylgeranylglycerol-phosphate geranylgeranyltransferase [Bacteroidota bacterium]
MAYLRLIRLPNLLIVVLTQYLLQYCILLPAFRAQSLQPALDHLHFALFVLSTLIIAAGGYIINDLEDIEIDRINKPERMVIGKVISEQAGRRGYYGLNALGLALAIYLAIHVGQLGLALLFPAAVGLLWWYSVQLKRLPLWGNLTVAIFCAFVAGIVLFAERSAFAQLQQLSPERAAPIAQLFAAYLAFALLSTLFRELIKDIEDRSGDQQLDCRTLPILIGIRWAKIVSFLLGCLLLLAVLYWSLRLWQIQGWTQLGYTALGIICPLCLSLWWLQKAERKADFSRLSLLAKYIMFSGILYLILHSTQ